MPQLMYFMFHKHGGRGSDNELIFSFHFFYSHGKNGVTTLETDLPFLFNEF